MTRLGLLLGGGGSVGIAWENGVLAALVDAIDFEPAAATIIVGTSAGSAVGADMALGKDPHDALVHDTDPDNPRTEVAVPDLERGPFAEILALMLSPEARTPEVVARIGELALQADTAMTEDRFVSMFRRTIGTDEWPAGDFRATAACCETGEPRFWSAADGIELSRAVASSCAIPGFFPCVSVDGRHYMDGARGRNYHASIVADCELDAALYIGPSIAAANIDRLIHDDMAAIAATGVRTHTMLGSDRLDAAGLELMDFTQRPVGFEIGLADGADHAAAVADLLG